MQSETFPPLETPSDTIVSIQNTYVCVAAQGLLTINPGFEKAPQNHRITDKADKILKY